MAYPLQHAEKPSVVLLVAGQRHPCGIRFVVPCVELHVANMHHKGELLLVQFRDKICELLFFELAVRHVANQREMEGAIADLRRSFAKRRNKHRSRDHQSYHVSPRRKLPSCDETRRRTSRSTVPGVAERRCAQIKLSPLRLACPPWVNRVVSCTR